MTNFIFLMILVALFSGATLFFLHSYMERTGVLFYTVLFCISAAYVMGKLL